MSSGASVPMLRANVIRKLQVPILPIEQQKRVVELCRNYEMGFFDAIRELLDGRENPVTDWIKSYSKDDYEFMLGSETAIENPISFLDQLARSSRCCGENFS